MGTKGNDKRNRFDNAIVLISHQFYTGTLKAHKKLQQAISNDNSRQEVHYYLIFETGTHLNPSVFSQGSENVPTNTNPLVCGNNANGNFSGKQLLAMTVYWKIAIAGGEQVEGEDEQNDQDMW